MDPEWEKKQKIPVSCINDMQPCHTIMYALREVGGTVRETQHGRLW